MSGGGDVVCTGWLRKSPPEKKLRRYVSAGESGCGRRGRGRGAPCGLREGCGLRGGPAPAGRAGLGAARGCAGYLHTCHRCAAEGRGGRPARLRLRLPLRGAGAAAAPP